MESFIINRTAVNFAMFWYNNEVDMESQIFLNSFPDDFEKFFQHALEVSLTPENGNRPDVNDVVFVITDGKAGVDVLAPSKALRDKGVTR
ncbi:collagen alpha-1(XIV) chain-like [Styela clava]